MRIIPESLKKGNHDAVRKTVTWIKYGLITAVIVYGSRGGNDALFCALAGIFELSAVIGITELLLDKHPHLGRILNAAASLILVAQYTVMHFGGTFISMIMLTNIHAVSALRGKASIYIGAAASAVIVSFLPVVRITRGRKGLSCAVPVVLAADVLVCSLTGTDVSAFASLASLNYTVLQREQMRRRVAKADFDSSDNDGLISHDETDDAQLPDVVLIFTEGLSQNIVDDSRNIMPNVKKYEQESLYFTNYFNHTAATYRGIGSQLHSGFQYEDMDDNNLTSLQDVFSQYGYETTLINPEPETADFNDHLSRFGFEHFISDDSKCRDGYIYDSDMYDLAYNLLDEPHDAPQLIVFYTFGTHVSMSSPDEVYGDGTSDYLNKFYNVDAQFGKFMDRIQSGSHNDNTMVVFTTDHATYTDDDYRNTFSGKYEYEREHGFCDEIPLLIWQNGIVPQVVDVDGRTSLDMAPTVLDYLGMQIPDSFLGSSLFKKVSDEQRLIETTFSIPVSNEYYSTDGGRFHKFSKRDRNYVKNLIEEYCIQSQS